MQEISYDELTPLQQETVMLRQAIAVMKPHELSAARFLEEEGAVLGFRDAEMFSDNVPIKWGPLRDLESGVVLPDEPAVEVGGQKSEVRRKRGSEPAAPFAEAPVPESVPVVTTVRIARASIIPSWLNPRTHFDAVKLEDLKGSLRKHGFEPGISHLLVRPIEYLVEDNVVTGSKVSVRTHPAAEWKPLRDLGLTLPLDMRAGWSTKEQVEEQVSLLPKYELVCGERRWRASGDLIAAGELADGLPAVVAVLTDLQVLELQIIENGQRDDLTPMEEGLGFRRLLAMMEGEKPAHTVDSLAAKIGKNPQYVRDRVSLCRLQGTLAGKSLEAGGISFVHARLLARIPGDKKRDELTKRVLARSEHGLVPYRDLEQWIAMEVQVELRGADFDQADPTLVPVVIDGSGERKMGGACGDCPFNTKNMPESADGAKGKSKFHMCMHPECFRAKETASEARWKAEQAKNGIVAFGKEDSAEFFDHTGKRLSPNKGYVELEEPPAAFELRSGVSSPGPWKKLIRGIEVPTVMLKDGDGKTHSVALRALCIAAARENKHDIFNAPVQAAPAQPAEEAHQDDSPIDRAAKSVQSEEERKKQDEAFRKEETKRRREYEIRARTQKCIARELVEQTRGLKKFTREFWLMLLAALVDSCTNSDGIEDACVALGMTVDSKVSYSEMREFLDKTIKGMDDAHLPSVALLTAYLTLYGEEKEDWLKLAGKQFGVDPKKAKQKAALEYDAEKKAEAAQKEIETGVAWGPLMEKVEDFTWLADGNAKNPNTAAVAMPAGVKLLAVVATARTEKGWVYGFELRQGKKIVAQTLPNLNATMYGNAALATRSALLGLHNAMVDAHAPAAVLERVKAYLEQVKVPEEKGAKPPAAKAKAKKGKGVKK